LGGCCSSRTISRLPVAVGFLASPSVLPRPLQTPTKLPPRRACALTPFQRSPLRRHAGSWAAWALPSAETPKRSCHGDSQAPLSQFIQRPPLHRHTTGASSPDRSPGCRMPTLQRVPLLPFLTTPAVYSAPTAVGLLHPTADHEVRPVSGRLPTVADNTTLLTDANTLRSFSLETRWKPVTQEHSLTKQKPKPLPFHEHPQFTEVPTPLDVPDDASTHTEVHASSSTSRPQGGDHASSPLSRGRVATTLRPDAPLGFSFDFRPSPRFRRSAKPPKQPHHRHSDHLGTHRSAYQMACAVTTAASHTPRSSWCLRRNTARSIELPAETGCATRTPQSTTPSTSGPSRTARRNHEGCILAYRGLPKTVPPCEQDDHPAEGSAEAKPLPPTRPPSTSCPCDQET